MIRLKEIISDVGAGTAQDNLYKVISELIAI
jgi:hypothetical protein